MKRLLFLLFMSVLLAAPATADTLRFHIGTYTDKPPSRGIYTGTLDTATGRLGPITLAATAPDPNFLALSPSAPVLYAALSPAHDDAIAAYTFGPDGQLTELNRQRAAGTGLCFVSTDLTGHTLFIANYSSGTIASYRLGPDGSVGQLVSTAAFHGSGPNPKRQKAPYAHSIYVSPDNAFVYACDLGSDHIWIFRFDATYGTLIPADEPSASVPPGSGPRHLAFGDSGRTVYVANELGNTVSVFTRNHTTGALTLLETVSTLPAATPVEGVTAAEIALHPNGHWLYVSNRGGGTDSISVFKIHLTDHLSLLQTAPAGVKLPRHFAIDPSGRWLLAAGQGDNRLALLKLDPATGLLSPTTESASVGTPVCILFDPPKL